MTTAAFTLMAVTIQKLATTTAMRNAMTGRAHIPVAQIKMLATLMQMQHVTMGVAITPLIAQALAVETGYQMPAAIATTPMELALAKS
jgi:hypothetical protein